MRTNCASLPPNLKALHRPRHISCVMAASMSRRAKLHAWRQETGRTPMKRLSYVAECASRPNPSTCTPLQKSKHAKHSVLTLKTLPSNKHISTHGNENVPPQGVEDGHLIESCTRRVSVAKPWQQGASKTELEKSRRQRLEEWQATNGRTLKRPPIFLKSTTADRRGVAKRLQKRRHTIGGGGRGVRWKGRFDQMTREALKEQLQQEIAQDYAEESGDEGGVDGLMRELSFHDTANGSRPEDKEVTATVQQDDGYIFKSTKVRFMLSEPRKRRSCMPCIRGQQHTVYVTPVRRSTREGRNQEAPGMKLDKERCFDSPSDVSKHLEFDDLQILSNDTLQLT